MPELVEGAKELERMLDQLPATVSKKIVRRSVRSGQKAMLAKAKEQVNSMVGGKLGALIARKLRIKAPRRQKRGQYLLSVEIRFDPLFVYTSKDGKRHYLPSAVEFGHGPKKEQIAIPFLRKAADSEGSNAQNIVIKELGNGIEIAAKQLAK